MRPPELETQEKSLLIAKLRSLLLAPAISNRLREEPSVAVVEIMLMGPDSWTVYVDDKESVYITEVVLQMGELISECTCPSGGDCVHVAAACHFFLTGQTSPPAPMFNSPALSPSASPIAKTQELDLVPATVNPFLANHFAAEFEKRLKRKLTTSELKAAQRIDFIHAKYGSPAKISLQDLVPLVDSALFYHPVGSVDLWKVRPETVWEAWVHLFFILGNQEVRALPALEQITSESEVSRVMAPQIRQAQIEDWKSFLRDGLKQDKLRTQLKREVLDLRLRLTSEALELVIRQAEEKSFTLLAAGKFRDMLRLEVEGNSPHLTRLGRVVWDAFTNQSANPRPNSTRLTHLGGLTARILRHHFEHPEALVTLENEAGELFEKASDKLVWHAREQEDPPQTYRLELALDNGLPPERPLCVVPSDPTLYFTETHFYTAPPSLNLLERLEELQAIPAAVIESREGVLLLDRLGAELPVKLREKVLKVTPRYHIELSLPEECVPWEAVRAELHADFGEQGGLENIGYSSTMFLTKPSTKDESVILFRDTSRHRAASNWMQQLDLSWSQTQRFWHRAMGDRFPEEFAQWILDLPQDVELKLTPLLETIRDGTLNGTLNLNISKKEKDWFDLSVAVDVEDNSLTPDEVRTLLKANGRWVRLKEKGYRKLNFNFSDEDAAKLADLGLTTRELGGETTRLHALQLAHPSVRKFLPQDASDAVQKRAGELQTIVTPDPPATIKATLRPYQIEGFQFLAYLSTNQFGGLLADDMGLGKTLQTLTWIAWLREQASEIQGPMLVVCPKSVTDNWLGEARRFLPSLRARRYFGTGSTNPELIANHLKTGDLFVINYAQLRNLSVELVLAEWQVVILDEAQYIKNPASQTTQAACKLKATHRLALSGTPIENRLLDLWSIMGFAMPGLLGSRASFLKAFNQKDDPLARRSLAARVRPFMLRRTKKEVASDLPERIEEDQLCEMEGPQETLYKAELKRAQQILLQAETDSSLDAVRFTILGSLTRLRQICCHPALISKDAELRTADSTKLNALMDLLEPLMEEGNKVLVFSQYTSMLDIIREEIARREWRQYLLTGATEDRGELVAAFQNYDGPAVFLISLKAGGSGLNLTSASYVVLYDPWWNPAVENQAIDRTHRIGQTSTVFAYRLLVKNSIEEKIRLLQKAKGSLAEDILGEESFGKALTKDDFKFLLG